MFPPTSHLRILIQTVVLIATFALAAHSIGQPCDNVFEQVPAGTNCTGSGQDCENTFDRVIDTCGTLKVAYTTAATHCSPVGMRFSLDGVLVYTSSLLGAGQSTGEIDLGPVSSGEHLLSMEAFGETAGCNNGFIETWSGTLSVRRCVEPPTVSDPSDSPACTSGVAVFGVTAGGTGPIAAQWEREVTPGSGLFIALEDGPTASWDGGGEGVGAIVSGATTLMLSIAADMANGLRLSAAHAIRYRCMVNNPCGSATSASARLVKCVADYNCSGAVSVQDIFDFLAGYFSADPLADVNESGAVSVQDIFDYLAAYFAGCD